MLVVGAFRVQHLVVRPDLSFQGRSFSCMDIKAVKGLKWGLGFDGALTGASGLSSPKGFRFHCHPWRWIELPGWARRWSQCGESHDLQQGQHQL